MASTHIGAAMRHLQNLFNTGVDSGVADDQLIRALCINARRVSLRDAVGAARADGPERLPGCAQESDDAQDAFQATFLILARKAGSVRAGSSLGSWLYRVAFNMAVQMNADGTRRREMETTGGGDRRPAGQTKWLGPT